MGSIAVSAGTAAAPGVRFREEPTTGIFRPGSGRIGESISGAQISDRSGTTAAYIMNSGDTIGFERSFKKSRGTPESPIIVSTGDTLGGTAFYAYDGASYLHAAEIGAVHNAQEPAEGSVYGDLVFYVTAGSGSIRQERMRLDCYGHFGINKIPGQTGNALEIGRTLGGGSLDEAVSLEQYNNAADGFPLQFFKSRNITKGSHTIVTSGDTLGTIIFKGSDGSAFRNGASIKAEVDGTPGSGDMPGRLVFSTTADGAFSVTERMRIDNAGRVGFGGTPVDGIDVIKTNTTGYNLHLKHFSADIYSISLYFSKSRNATAGSHTIVQSGDVLGSVTFRGSDGSGWRDAASIRGECDGTPGSNDMPGRLVFSTTPDGDTVAAERMRISNAGYVGIGITSPGYGIDVEKEAGDTSAKFGDATPLYIVSNVLAHGFNVYSNSGWKFGKGSSSKYAGLLQYDVTNAYFAFFNSSAPGNADAACTLVDNTRFYSGSNSSRIHLNGNAIEVGVGQLSDTSSYIDFHAAEGTYSDYCLRLERQSGANGISNLIHKGTGTFTISTNEAAALSFKTTAAERFNISSGGDVTTTFLGNTNPYYVKYTADSNGTTFLIQKSRSNGSVGQTIVQSGDNIGNILFQGSDGTQFLTVAYIGCAVDGTPGTNDMPGRLTFFTTPDGSATSAERMRIDNAGRIGINKTPATGRLEIARTESSGYDVRFEQFSADSVGVPLYFNKSRNATVGSHTVVQSGDVLGQIIFRGSDGSSYVNAAAIYAEVDGTPGASDMPGRLTFHTTADGASTLSERMRIDNAGRVGFSGTPTQGIESIMTASTGFNYYGKKFSNDAAGMSFYFDKSRNATAGSHTIVQDGDVCGSLSFRGSDGSAFRDAASIRGEIDGTPGSNDMPGRLVFSTTPDGSTSATERMRITNDGSIYAYALSSGAGTNTMKYDTGTKEFTYDTSDVRVKDNFEDLSYGLNEVLKITPKFFDQYDCHYHPRSGAIIKDCSFQKTGGFVAQEVHAVAPRAVHAPEEGLWNINDRLMLGILWKGVQELNTARMADMRDLDLKVGGLKDKVESLEAQNKELKAKNESLEARLLKLEQAAQN